MQIEAADSVPIGHPARTYHQGNLALEALLDELERNMAEAEDASAICREFPKLMAIHQHYGIKEMLFMTVLYRHGVTGPSQALWKADDEIKKEIRALVRDLLPTTCMERKERMVAVMTRLREMVSKDEKILLPMSLRFFTIEDWYMVYRDSLLMGAGFLPEIPHWEEGDVWCEKRLKEETAKLNDSRVKLPTGELTLGELKCLFSHLPLDITFIDKDDVLRFFFLDNLRKASVKAKMITLADKLSNMRITKRTFNEKGTDMWRGVHQTDHNLQGWYYKSILGCVSELKDTAAYKEYSELCDYVFGE